MLDIEGLRRIARRHVRTPEEAEDVVQEVLVGAVAAGRRLDEAGFQAWARGAIRRQAAFLARGAGRRARREAAWRPPEPDAPPAFPPHFVAALPPGLRRLARLVDAGLDRREIAWLLGLTDDAFRQRLAALRLRWRASGLAGDTRRAASGSDRLALGLLRRALKRRLAAVDGPAVGSHDPDGHLLIFSDTASRSARARQQGGMQPPVQGGTP